MRRFSGQATTEWLLVSLGLLTLLWALDSNQWLSDYLREQGDKLLEHYHFMLNVLSLIPGTGL